MLGAPIGGLAGRRRGAAAARRRGWAPGGSSAGSPTACTRCGRVFCPRCQPGRRGELCSQCHHIFVKKEGVDARVRVQKMGEIKSWRRLLRIRHIVCAVLAPGRRPPLERQVLARRAAAAAGVVLRGPGAARARACSPRRGASGAPPSSWFAARRHRRLRRALAAEPLADACAWRTRRPMALEGTFKDFGLADIFQLVGLQKKTGVLTVRGEGGRLVTVSFEKGAVVFADEFQRTEAERLGNVLLRTRLLTQEQLDAAMAVQKSTVAAARARPDRAEAHHAAGAAPGPPAPGEGDRLPALPLAGGELPLQPRAGDVRPARSTRPSPRSSC